MGFMNALDGFLYALKTELNIVIHLSFATLVLSYLMYVRAEIHHFVLAYIAIFIVISFELMNTALERLCDLVEPEYSQDVKNIKDVSVSAVLLNAMFAVVMGYVIWITL